MIGPDGEALGTTGDDPIGVAFWRLWYASRISFEASTFSLTDVARSFGVSDDENARPFDAETAGKPSWTTCALRHRAATRR